MRGEVWGEGSHHSPARWTVRWTPGEDPGEQVSNQVNQVKTHPGLYRSPLYHLWLPEPDWARAGESRALLLDDGSTNQRRGFPVGGHVYALVSFEWSLSLSLCLCCNCVVIVRCHWTLVRPIRGGDSELAGVLAWSKAWSDWAHLLVKPNSALQICKIMIYLLLAWPRRVKGFYSGLKLSNDWADLLMKHILGKIMHGYMHNV